MVKIKKQIFFSTFFLFVFLSAFSAGVYPSLNNSLKEFCHFSKHKELKTDGTNSTSEGLVFEETENNVEESVSPESAIIPGLLKFNCVNSSLNYIPSESLHSVKTFGSIFLSIRVIRI